MALAIPGIDPAVERKFWRLFNRVLGCDVAPGAHRVDDVEAWDSLRHVELMFEMEEAFDLDIDPDDIVSLYSDTATILRYLAREVASDDA